MLEPLWHPGSLAFWLEPKPHEIEAGRWPMPCTARRDLPVYLNGTWYHKGREVVAFDYTLVDGDNHRMTYKNGRSALISDQDLGYASLNRPKGYLTKGFYDEIRSDRDRRRTRRIERRPKRSIRGAIRALACGNRWWPSRNFQPN